MNFADRCEQEFETDARNRGSSYYRDGLVQIEDVEENRVYASVTGSYGNQYDVVIDWVDVEELGVLAAKCTCPRFADGWLCKHIWATVREIDREGLSGYVGGPIDLFIDGDDSLGMEGSLAATSTMKLVPQVNSSAKRSVKEKTVRATRRKKKKSKVKKPQWQKTFDMLKQKQFSYGGKNIDKLTDALITKRREIWYVMSIGQSIANGSLIVEFLQRESKMNGELGKIKRLLINEHDVDSISNSVDRELLSQLINFEYDTDYNSSYRYRDYGYQKNIDAVEIPPTLYDYFLPRLAATGRFVWMLDIGQPFEDAKPLAWGGDSPWQFEMFISPDDKRQCWNLDGRYSRDGQIRPLHEAVMATPTGLLLIDDTLHKLDVDHAIYDWIYALSTSSPVEVPYRDRQSFLEQLWSAPALPKIELPKNLQWEQIYEAPQARLRIYSPDKTARNRRQDFLVADVSFLYGTQEVRAEDWQCGFPEEQVPNTNDASTNGASTNGASARKSHAQNSTAKKSVAKKARDKASAGSSRVYMRDRDAEANRLLELGNLGVRQSDQYYGSKGDVQFRQKRLVTLVDQLAAKGWQVEAEGKLFRTAGEFKIEVQSDIDWFELDAAFDFDGIEAKLPELLAAVRKGEKFVELGDGTRGILPAEWLARYQHLANLGAVEDGKVRFKPSQALLLDAMLDEQENLRIDQKFRQFRQRLSAFQGVKAKNEPKTFCGTLRDYQRDGLGWFHFLRELGLGGCLADDMGLGKTIQVLALLENRRTRRLRKDETRWPSLVVAPKSLIFNWIDEAERFTPKLRVADYTGLERKQLTQKLDEFHLVVTTYGTMRRDIAELKDQRFDYAILDESQAIKNSASQAAKASRLLNASHHLTLTGTPIENHLGELWSLFEFLNPGMLGRSGAFASLCKSAKSDDLGSLTDLSRAVAPFILRRTKDQVLKELPEKTEQTIHCDLLPKQRKQYDELRDYYRAKLTKKIDERGLKQSKIHVLEALLRLRQAACHPGLVDKKLTTEPSAKLEVLLEQIHEIIAEGHKALVFSQFTSLLAIVRTTLDEKGICYEYLDGNTRKRKEKVDRFQTDAACPLFLISLKAGGSGLNLTAADYVFILDPWWNPAVEAQAIDRTHRIGQTQSVFAYRIIARDTVEEKVLKLQESKRSLANAIITADESLIRNLTADDLKMILS